MKHLAKSTVGRRKADNPSRSATNTRTLLAFLWTYIKPHMRFLVIPIILLPFIASLQVAPPWIIGQIIDRALTQQDTATLKNLCILLIGVFLLQHLLNLVQSLSILHCGQRAMHSLRQRIFSHALSLSCRYYDNQPIGGLVTRMSNDPESIAEAFSSGLIALIADIIRLVMITITMFVINYRLAILSLILIPPLFVFVQLMQKQLRGEYRRSRGFLTTLNAKMSEQIAGIRVIQLFGIEGRQADQFDTANSSYRNAYKQAIRLDATLFAGVEFVGTLSVAIVLFYGFRTIVPSIATTTVSTTDSSAAISTGISIGILVTFLEYIQRFFEPVRDISSKFAVLQQALASTERVKHFLTLSDFDGKKNILQSHLESSLVPNRQPIQQRHTADDTLPPSLVSFAKVNFSYGDKALFRGLSFDLKKGQEIAFVGTSGSGKSTIARLLTRFYELDGGSIQLENKDISDIPLVELRRRITLVGQDVFLFQGTVYDNIALGNRKIDRDTVHKTIETLGINGQVNVDDVVQERGANLSLGQRQLIVFCRAMIRQPDVLILDEATAHIDPESESIVRSSLKKLKSTFSTITIAHRLDTITNADTIYAMQYGKIVESGTHQSLMKEAGYYATLYQSFLELE